MQIEVPACARHGGRSAFALGSSGRGAGPIEALQRGGLDRDERAAVCGSGCHRAAVTSQCYGVPELGGQGSFDAVGGKGSVYAPDLHWRARHRNAVCNNCWEEGAAAGLHLLDVVPDRCDVDKMEVNAL